MSAVTLLWAAFAGCAVLDWWCCVRPHPRLEAVVKPGAMIALMGIALLSGAQAHPTGVWLLVALVFCVLGDVLLLGDSDARFRGGLLAFLLGHLAYAVCFLRLGLDHPWWGAAALVALAGSMPWATRIVRGAAAAGGPVLAGMVAGYVLVIGVMAVLAWSTGLVLVAVGAGLFVVSDLVLGLGRFVGQRPWTRLAVMVTYLLAQALLVVGVLAALRP